MSTPDTTSPQPATPAGPGVAITSGVFPSNAVVKAFKARDENQLRSEGSEQVGERIVDADGNVGFAGLEVGARYFLTGYVAGVYVELAVRAIDLDAPNAAVVQAPPEEPEVTQGYSNTPPPPQDPQPPVVEEGQEQIPVGVPEEAAELTPPATANGEATAHSTVPSQEATEPSQEATEPTVEPPTPSTSTATPSEPPAPTPDAADTAPAEPAAEPAAPESVPAETPAPEAAPPPAEAQPSESSSPLSGEQEASQAPAQEAQPEGSPAAQDAPAPAPDSQPAPPAPDNPPETPAP